MEDILLGEKFTVVFSSLKLILYAKIRSALSRRISKLSRPSLFSLSGYVKSYMPGNLLVKRLCTFSRILIYFLVYGDQIGEQYSSSGLT